MAKGSDLFHILHQSLPFGRWRARRPRRPRLHARHDRGHGPRPREIEHWRTVFELNVFAANLVTAAAIPHLEASGGTAIFLSSVSAHVTPPWVGMGLYAASKVALEKTVEVWKLEHPDVRFTTIVVGSTAGGHFFADATIPDPTALE